MRLFFPQEAKATLVEEEREHLASGPPSRTVCGRCSQGLTKAAGREGTAPLPPPAQIRQVFLDDFGILYLDFHQGIQTADGGRRGAGGDSAVAAIVLTLTTNFQRGEAGPVPRRRARN